MQTPGLEAVWDIELPLLARESPAGMRGTDDRLSSTRTQRSRQVASGQGNRWESIHACPRLVAGSICFRGNLLTIGTIAV